MSRKSPLSTPADAPRGTPGHPREKNPIISVPTPGKKQAFFERFTIVRVPSPSHLHPRRSPPKDEDEGIRADYKWDQTPELITFSAFGVLYNWHLPVGLIMREALGRAHHYVHRMPPPGAFEKHFRSSHEEA